ncbi:hypothetical protein [Streptomyces fumanus]|uniref:Uncharacterized protein n=1 Tax=Streptomyces fumanus TaxID=67302 RepID=A0A919AUZ2_9ACTN|nr:hypothetical protein [Streptomyces fumanus]GHF26888.1 hypothetical protein GCM10018772_60780 [Streptomyces fumanus]
MAKVPVPHRIGEPRTEAEFLPDTLPEELSDRLASFLEEAEPILYSPGTMPDPFSDSPDMHVRVGIMTDGEWVWHLAWSDYVKYHRVSPPDDFLEHITALDYTAPDITVEHAMEIAEAEGIPMPD